MNRLNRNKIEPRQEYWAQHMGEDSCKLIIITSGARGCWLVTLLHGLFCNHENTELGVNTQELKTIDLPQVAPFIKHRIRSGWFQLLGSQNNGIQEIQRVDIYIFDVFQVAKSLSRLPCSLLHIY